MGDKVVSLADRRPHMSGAARCLDCKHEWQAVAPIGTLWLECPNCTLVRGRAIYHHSRDGVEYTCNCGNDLMRLKPEGCYCPNCGEWANV